MLRLSGVTDAFLDIVAFDLDLVRPGGEPSDICAALKTLAEELRETRGAGKAAVALSVPNRTLPVRMELHWLQTLLSELVSSALALSRNGKLKISLSPKKANVMLNADCARSRLPPDGKLPLFLPFFLLPENLYPQGGRRGGLALSLVRRIVTLHGGSIKAARLGENGFSIIVKLPLCGEHGTR
jgi:K+-sensing histidine kinase KdpD